MVTWCIHWRRLKALIFFQRSYFSAQFIKVISHYKKFAITLMYCNRLHAWWSTQSRLTTLLSSLIARQWVWLQTLWRYRLKDLSIDAMVGDWSFGCCQTHRGNLFFFFCSGIQFYILFSPYLCVISFLYLDLYALADDAWISYGSFMQTKHL